MTEQNSLKRYLVLWSMIVSMLSPGLLFSQNIISADPSDMFDTEAIFVNPAVTPFQHRQVTLGMRVYQLGFLASQELGLRSSYFSISLPGTFSGLLNLGLTGQNFSVPLYDQTNFSFSIAKRPFERLSIGIKYNLFTKSYHQKYFDLMNENDPVFANGTLKFSQSVGIGFILFPWSTLAVGFSCDHLNRPDVSISADNFRQPLSYDFGVRYSWRYFSSSVFFNYVQQFWQFNWILESRPSTSSILKVGFVQQAARFSVRLDIFNGFSISYGFDYPFYEVNQLSHGSHQIGVSYNLDHHDRIKQLQYTHYNQGKFPIFNLPSQFFVEMNCDTLEIMTQKIVRTIDESVPQSALANLTDMELAINDSALSLGQLYEHGMVQQQQLNSFYNSAKYSHKYQQWFVENLFSKRIDSLKLIASMNSIQRALDLRDSLLTLAPFFKQHIELKQLNGSTISKPMKKQLLERVAKEQNIILQPKSVRFHITSLKINKYQGSWKLVISDYSHREIKTFEGKGNAPESITWDWRDNNGSIIKPDIYYYYFQWKDKNGHDRKSQPKMFSVVKIARTLNIDIRSEPDDNGTSAGSVVEIKLMN